MEGGRRERLREEGWGQREEGQHDDEDERWRDDVADVTSCLSGTFLMSQWMTSPKLTSVTSNGFTGR